MYKGKKISVVFPAYNEEKNIRKSVDEFFDVSVVDEVIVINNNSKDNTEKEARKTKATVILEKKQGYGNAIRRGLKEASGDIIFTCEPDGTFQAVDLLKYLLYWEDGFEVVFGTRTSRALIWENAKMNWFLRLGNEVVAKLLEYLHNGPCLTDVGCTFKMMTRRAVNMLNPLFTVGGSSFSVENMILAIRKKLKCVEIPVNYKERIGDSKITSTFWKSFKLGVIMINLIIGYRLGYKGKL